MKITDVRVEKYRWPKEKPIANGKHRLHPQRAEPADCGHRRGDYRIRLHWAIEFADTMGKAIIGEDPLNTERLWKKTHVPKFIGRRGTSCKTVSAIDIALWDIKAKVARGSRCTAYCGRIPGERSLLCGGRSYYAKDKGLKELQQEEYDEEES